MTTTLRLSVQQARLLHLAAQGLLDAAAPARAQGGRARRDRAHARAADRHDPRRRAQSVPRAVFAARRVSPALARRTARSGRDLRMLGARSLLRADRGLCAASPARARAPRPLGDEARAAHASRAGAGDGRAARARPRDRAGQVVRLRTRRRAPAAGGAGKTKSAGSKRCSRSAS